jgi:hypothetical protein
MQLLLGEQRWHCLPAFCLQRDAARRRRDEEAELEKKNPLQQYVELLGSQDEAAWKEWLIGMGQVQLYCLEQALDRLAALPARPAHCTTASGWSRRSNLLYRCAERGGAQAVQAQRQDPQQAPQQARH